MRTLFPSLLVVVLCSAVAAATVGAQDALALVSALAPTVWGLAERGLRVEGRFWLCGDGAPASRRVRLSAAERVLRFGVAALLVALGLTMPVISRGLLERDRLGMADQVRALLTGYFDPQAAHLVAA